MEQKGYSEQVASNMINSGGLKIYATIDTNVQNILGYGLGGRFGVPQYGEVW